MSAIKTVGLVKRYGEVTALDSLELEVREGELFSLLGVNGAGKTTLVKILTGISRADEGEAYLDGKSIKEELSEIKEIIGVSPQETAVAPNLTVEENLELICRVRGFSAKESREKVADISEKFKFGQIQKRRAGKLSGGWQRRLSIAMALISEPKILFLDEPTLALDVIARSELWDMIRALKGKVTMILTTHYMEEAEALSDRIGVMSEGRMIAVGTPAELLERTDSKRIEEAFIKLVKEESNK